MKFVFTSIVVAVISAAQTAVATPAPVPVAEIGNSTQAADFGINLGNTFNNDVAWVDGGSKCTVVAIAAFNTNPCGHAFSLKGQTFTVNGCGGPLWITQGSTFWANCGSLSEADSCGVHTTYHCL